MAQDGFRWIGDIGYATPEEIEAFMVAHGDVLADLEGFLCAQMRKAAGRTICKHPLPGLDQYSSQSGPFTYYLIGSNLGRIRQFQYFVLYEANGIQEPILAMQFVSGRPGGRPDCLPPRMDVEAAYSFYRRAHEEVYRERFLADDVYEDEGGNFRFVRRHKGTLVSFEATESVQVRAPDGKWYACIEAEARGGITASLRPPANL
jgi:hypothetical protein